MEWATVGFACRQCFLKIRYKDIEEFVRTSREVAQYYDSWPEDNISKLYALIKTPEHGVFKNKYGMFDNHFSCTMVVEGLTPKGRVKKYPIRVNVLLTVYEEVDRLISRSDEEEKTRSDSETLVLEASYLGNGAIGKARIQSIVNGEFLRASFLRGADGFVFVDKVERGVSDGGRSAWVRVY